MAVCKPNVTITSPLSSTTYKGGDEITFSGVAFDSIDGHLAPSAFVWYLDFHHSEHVHDGPPILRNADKGTYQLSTTNEVDADVFYRLILIVKNSRDETDTAFVDILPRLVNLTIVSNVNGVTYSQFGTSGTYSTPSQRTAVQNMFWVLFTQKEQVVNGDTLLFTHWAGNGCSEAFTFDVPQNDTLIHVFFEKKSERTMRTTFSTEFFTTIDTLLTNVPPSLHICTHTVSSTIVSIPGCGVTTTTSTLTGCNIISITSSFVPLYTDNPVNIYPNPAIDVLHINGIPIKIIEVYDILGNKYSLTYSEGGNNDYHLNVSTLKKGLYFLKLHAKTGSLLTSKFTIL